MTREVLVYVARMSRSNTQDTDDALASHRILPG